METTTDHTTGEVTDPQTVFSRVLVGVDGSAESRVAARVGALLLEAGGVLTLLAAYDVAPSIVGGTGESVPAYYFENVQRRAAKDVLRDAGEAIQGRLTPLAKVARGRPWSELIREAEREEDTLIVVGSHGIGRARGIVLGSTATELLHKAPCSVLVARRAGPTFPQRIVVGVDGSLESATAHAVARLLAARFGAELTPVVAHGGEGLDELLVGAIVGHDRKDLTAEPVPALVGAAFEADLLVVGSRGLHGLASLGSVSERVAHQARSSVLVVREPLWQLGAEETSR